MPLRDAAVIGFLLWTIPHILRKPWLGILVWSWVSYMYPHRLCFSFAYSFPVAQLAAGALFAGMLLTKEKLQLPKHPLIGVWIMFIVWINVAFAVALVPEAAYEEWDRSMKIQLITFCTLALINDKKKIIAMVAVIAFSVGFFGIKGGLFAIRTGLSGTVWGPPGSFYEGNNELALALLLVVPMFRFLQLQAEKTWHKYGLMAIMMLCMLSVIASYSRGAFLALSVAGMMLVLKSRQRFVLLFLFILAIPIVVVNLPEKWTNRMSTIETYEQDASAMGRINAWKFAINIAKDRPLSGGGLATFTPNLFLIYAPNPTDFHDAHSIYFEILAETGFFGLSLFLTLFISAYVIAGRTAKRAKAKPELSWAVDLCSMTQVSLACYASGGAFLGLGYFDLPYHIVAIILLTWRVVDNDLKEDAKRARSHPPVGPPDGPGEVAMTYR